MTSALVAGKRMTLFGKHYDIGQEVPDADQLPLERLRVLQNVGFLVPVPVETPKKKEAKNSG